MHLFSKPRTEDVRAFFSRVVHERVGNAFPNWDPGVEMKVGDVGIIDPITQEFLAEQNIWKDALLPPDILEEYRPMESPPEDLRSICSVLKDGKYISVTPLRVSDKWGDGFHAKWTIHKGTEAMATYVLTKPAQISIPYKQKLIHELLRRYPNLEGKHLVTCVHTCRSYVRLINMDTKLTQDATIHLKVHHVGKSSMTTEWYHDRAVGEWRSAGEDGRSTFYPLYERSELKARLPATRPKRLRKRTLSASRVYPYISKDDLVLAHRVLSTSQRRLIESDMRGRSVAGTIGPVPHDSQALAKRSDTPLKRHTRRQCALDDGDRSQRDAESDRGQTQTQDYDSTRDDKSSKRTDAHGSPRHIRKHNEAAPKEREKSGSAEKRSEAETKESARSRSKERHGEGRDKPTRTRERDTPPTRKRTASFSGEQPVLPACDKRQKRREARNDR
ncbi:hypothetical protein NM688_g3162 [Phlebia brevispora]|uniref:Uncharacterized protein n=1 Tax=Phlebia brevispora TaxID=194682 RepID=A0ACC1T6M8_9APHY|nr:hypothetical protein NM688_g3162 [Phlebia brevispora]